ncbi:MAG: tetratricopeptide repeat protein [Candidatus Gastranaerophilales bacterium]|nr:tetratricopeptide repeat protein [Candidatus Gastranaerophilales bacterium]
MFTQKSPQDVLNIEFNELSPERESNDLISQATAAHQQYILRANNEDLINAINLYIKAIKVNPDIPSAYYRLASLMHESGQIGLDGALEQCRRAVELDPKNASARMYLGYFLSQNGEYEKATEQFKAAMKLKPTSSHRARLAMALAFLENRKKNHGSADFISFSKAMFYIFSGSVFFLFDKAGIKMFCKNIINDLNFAKYRAVGKILEKTNLDKNAYELYSDALDNTKNAPLFYEKMAGIAIKKERPEVALQCYQNAVQLSNHNPETVVDLIEFIEANFPEKVDDLIDNYTILIKKLPDFSRGYYELGNLYLKKEEKINAVSAFKLALEGEPDNPFYQNSLAFAYVQLEQYDSAIELYKKALENNPDNEWTAVVAQALAAIYHRIKGNFDAAISMLQNALILTKNKTEIYLSLADIYYDIDDMDEAIKYYTLAIEGGYKDAKVFSRLAMAFWERDYVENAIEFYNRAIDIEPDYEIAYNNLGVVYFDGLNDAERAKPCFEAALKLNDNYTMAHFNMARYYETKGNKVSAANEYQYALDLNKVYPEIDDEIIEERLFKLFET